MRNVSANNRLKSFKFCIYTQYTELCILCCCYGDRFVSLVAIMKEIYSNVDGKLDATKAEADNTNFGLDNS